MDRVLLVEGKDDENVVYHLCRAHGLLLERGLIQPCEGPGKYADAGVDHLLDEVPLRLKGRVERLGVLLDADENAETRWIQLRDRLRHAGFENVPDRPRPEGTILDLDMEAHVVRFGVWIMPDNRLPGMLEDFLALLVPAGDTMMPRVDAFLDGIPAGERLFSDRAMPKARIHAFLAIQREPGKPLGLAIANKFLDPKREETVGPFLRWFRAVFFD